MSQYDIILCMCEYVIVNESNTENTRGHHPQRKLYSLT